jgi:tetratricopeptide (TPR) repeat protein
MRVYDRNLLGWMVLRAVVLGLLAAFVPVAQGAQDEATARREKALSELQGGNAEARAKGILVLAEHGKPSDLPPVMAALYDPDETVRRAAEQAVWRIWSRSGDAAADRVFETGVAQMRDGNWREAAATFGRVIEMKPEFAEAWNKRATIYFMLGEYDLSLRDCDEVLKRNPQHFGVLAGYGQIHLRKDDLAKALEYFERALAINPNMDGVRDSIEAIGKILAEKQKRFI